MNVYQNFIDNNLEAIKTKQIKLMLNLLEKKNSPLIDGVIHSKLMVVMTT